MKKFLSIMLMATLVLSLTACVNTTDPEDPVDPVVTCKDDETKVGDQCIKNDTLDLEALDSALETFKLTDTLTEVTSDMTLPTTIGDSITIAWESSNTAVVSNEGKVVRPTAQNETVTLTATFTLNTQVKTKTFEVTVLKQLSAPVLTVNETAFVTITQGDLTSLEGATANDLNDGDLTSQIVINSDSFNIDVPGFYNVTLVIKDSDNEEATKNVTIQVQPVEPIMVTGETWGIAEENIETLLIFDIVENFTDDQVFNVSFNGGVISRPTIFINTSSEVKTLHVTNAYGVAAVFNANGVVTEGRDGANGRLVDNNCGLRTLCAQGSLEAGNPLTNLVVQPGGFVIVAPNNNTDYNEDGRKFVNEQLINRIDKVVTVTQDDELIYTEADQAPFFVIGGKVKPEGSFTLTATRDVELSLMDSIDVYDWDATLNEGAGGYGIIEKSETFDPIKLVTIYNELGEEVTVEDYTKFTFTESGSYDIEFVIQDEAGNTRTIETQMTVIVFDELPTAAFKIVDENGDDLYIDLMKVGYTYNFKDDNDIDTAKYHIYDDYQALLNDTTSLPHAMGWGSFIIYDELTGNIEVNYNIFHGNVFVAEGVNYFDEDLNDSDAQGLKGITDLPEGKILLVAPQNTAYRTFALGSTSRDLTTASIQFINVAEVPSASQVIDYPAIVIDKDGTPVVIDLTGYIQDQDFTGTDAITTYEGVHIITNLDSITGLNGTAVEMNYGSYMIIDMESLVVEVYANWGNIFTIEGVDYVDTSSVLTSDMLESITSLPEGKILVIGQQNTTLRNEMYNTVGNNTDITGTTIRHYNIEITEAEEPVNLDPTFVFEFNGQTIEIDLTGYVFDTAITGTNNMPTGNVYIVENYNNIIGLDSTPVNMGYGSYLVIDKATMTVEVYANWSAVHMLDTVDYVDASALNGATVLDTLTSLPEGKILIINPQGTDMRTDLYDGSKVGNNADISGLTVQIHTVTELND